MRPAVRLALRAWVLLAATMPVFAATAFRPAWWMVLIAAMVGSALGQLVVRVTHDRRIAQGCVAGVALAVVGVAIGWSFRHRTASDVPASGGYLVVKGPSLTWDDLHAIQTLVKSAELVVPYQHHAEQLISEDQNWSSEVVGTSPDYFTLMELHLAAGQWFDAAQTGKVVIVGDTVAHNLFGAQADPIGAEIRIHSQPFTIIGVLAHRGMTDQGQDLDDVAIVPTAIYVQKFAATFRNRLDGVMLISPKSRDEVERLETEIRSLLRDRHLVGGGTEDDFTIRRM